MQVKHHWFWKLNTVFNSLESLRGKHFSVLLLEEDYLVLPDVLTIHKLALATMEQKCPKCRTISLGNYRKAVDYRSESDGADVRAWVSSAHNIGMVITRSFYKELASCKRRFCSYDDYNWDWSVQALAPQCLKDLYVLAVAAPRVLHIGSCDGMHVKQQRRQRCDAAEQAQMAVKHVEKGWLFPNRLRVTTKLLKPASAPFVNGGWGDVRDHRLCESYERLSKEAALL